MQVFSISQLNGLIKRTIEREYILKNCYVSGVIANLKHHSNGHYYFTLKDDDASIDVTLWSSTARGKSFVTEMGNGLLVTIRASLSFYEKQGRLNLVCNDMQIGEKSAYQLAYEQLKAELTALGYFEEAHKQQLPLIPSCIGMVTSESGAVMHDILRVARQRNPLVQFKLFSVPVQGAKAGPVIARGIEVADADPEVELIIVGRGGGSMEDLWCFNDRQVVEAVYRCKTPIISAVGHETDFTLCDFAADVRGATPSHAAELAVYPTVYLLEALEQKRRYLDDYVAREIDSRKQQLAVIFNRRLGIPALQLIHRQRSSLEALRSRLELQMEGHLRENKQQLALLGRQLTLLNPLNLLLKGYSKVELQGQAVHSVEQVACGDHIAVTVADGTIGAVVEEVTSHGQYPEKL